MKDQSGKSIVRKAFICPDCEGVYADAPTTSCDCCGPRCQEHFAIRGTIRYEFPVKYGARPEQDLGSEQDGYDLDALLAELNNLREQNTALSGHLASAHRFVESTAAFGDSAQSGILQAGQDPATAWNIDESKQVLAQANSKRPS
jgi:hypothetical protein